MRGARALPGLGLAAALAACATAPPSPAPRLPSPTAPSPARWSELPGWAAEDHLGALGAVRAACRLGRPVGLASACRELERGPPQDDAAARDFFERRFGLARLPGEGLLTAYYTPVYEARTAPDPLFNAPLRPAPPPLEPGDPAPERAAIEATPAPDALAWMRPEDLFFLQIQGSGVLDFPDGRRLKAGFAASNDRPFIGLAKVMRQMGLIDDAHSSGEEIHAWLAAHRGPEANAVMRQNPRYAYLTLRPDDGVDPLGAAGIPLPAGRALAVDPSRRGFGELYWIDASVPALAAAVPAYRRLAAALDAGGAIKGDLRADLYLGEGEAAGREAGRVRHRLTLYQLQPR